MKRRLKNGRFCLFLMAFHQVLFIYELQIDRCESAPGVFLSFETFGNVTKTRK